MPAPLFGGFWNRRQTTRESRNAQAQAPAPCPPQQVGLIDRADGTEHPLPASGGNPTFTYPDALSDTGDTFGRDAGENAMHPPQESGLIDHFGNREPLPETEPEAFVYPDSLASQELPESATLPSQAMRTRRALPDSPALDIPHDPPIEGYYALEQRAEIPSGLEGPNSRDVRRTSIDGFMAPQVSGILHEDGREEILSVTNTPEFGHPFNQHDLGGNSPEAAPIRTLMDKFSYNARFYWRYLFRRF